MEHKIRILLADDHHIVVEGIKEILKTMNDAEVVAVAYDGEELLKVARTNPADLAILDVNMPHKDGIQCTRILKKEFPQIKILILTMYHERTLINDIIQAGADGCMLKSKGTQELREAVSRVINNKSYFDFIPEFKANEEQEKVKLSKREIEIIKLIVCGKTSLEIADQLFISEHTVKTHRKNVLRKLKINNANQLTAYAINRGWGAVN